MAQANTHPAGVRFRPQRVPAATAAVAVLIASGCAATSAGDRSPVRESLAAQCVSGQIKECRVWGGNKFRRRYEYCGCRS